MADVANDAALTKIIMDFTGIFTVTTVFVGGQCRHDALARERFDRSAADRIRPWIWCEGDDFTAAS